MIKQTKLVKKTLFLMCVCFFFFFFFLFCESKYFSMRFPLFIEIVLVSSDALHLVQQRSSPFRYGSISAHALRKIKLMIPLICWRVAIGMWPPNMALCFPLQPLTAPPKINLPSRWKRRDSLHCKLSTSSVNGGESWQPPFFVAV